MDIRAEGPLLRQTTTLTFDGDGLPLDQLSDVLADPPDLVFNIAEGLSGRSARLVLRYPGGPQELAVALAQHGLILRNGGNGWVLTQR